MIAGLVAYPEEYKHSSAKFYFDGSGDFKMTNHYSGTNN